MLVLNSAGDVLQRERLEATGEVRGVQLAEGQFHTLVALDANSVMLEIKRAAKPTKPVLPRQTARGLVALWVDKCEREKQRRFQFKFFCDFVESQWLGGDHDWHPDDLVKGEANAPRWRITAQSALQDERNTRVAYNKNLKVWSIL